METEDQRLIRHRITRLRTELAFAVSDQLRQGPSHEQEAAMLRRQIRELERQLEQARPAGGPGPDGRAPAAARPS